MVCPEETELNPQGDLDVVQAEEWEKGEGKAAGEVQDQ